MRETLSQKRTREHNERIAARQCIADIEATFDSLASDFARLREIKERIRAYNQEIVK